ncbi:MAG: sulfite exporter TauE/SafE family protein [Hydrogenophaga sp.]
MDFFGVDASAWLLLVVAAFAAGVLNAVAGGGSFLTFPALVFTGVPPIVANATSALAVSPGYAGSTLGFKTELQALPRRRLQRGMGISALGGVLGALLLLVTPASVFLGLVPALLLFATVLFAIGPRLAARSAQGVETSDSPWREPGLLVVAIYGGYFNGGLGILLMALYTLTGEGRIHTVNALKNLNSLVLSLLSVVAFVVAGVIAWPQGLAMMVAATAGGFWGARWSKRLPVLWVRRGVIATGLVMSAVFFVRAFG